MAAVRGRARGLLSFLLLSLCFSHAGWGVSAVRLTVTRGSRAQQAPALSATKPVSTDVIVEGQPVGSANPKLAKVEGGLEELSELVKQMQRYRTTGDTKAVDTDLDQQTMLRKGVARALARLNAVLETMFTQVKTDEAAFRDFKNKVLADEVAQTNTDLSWPAIKDLVASEVDTGRDKIQSAVEQFKIDLLENLQHGLDSLRAELRAKVTAGFTPVRPGGPGAPGGSSASGGPTPIQGSGGNAPNSGSSSNSGSGGAGSQSANDGAASSNQGGSGLTGVPDPSAFHGSGGPSGGSSVVPTTPYLTADQSDGDRLSEEDMTLEDEGYTRGSIRRPEPVPPMALPFPRRDEVPAAAASAGGDASANAEPIQQPMDTMDRSARQNAKDVLEAYGETAHHALQQLKHELKGRVSRKDMLGEIMTRLDQVVASGGEKPSAVTLTAVDMMKQEMMRALEREKRKSIEASLRSAELDRFADTTLRKYATPDKGSADVDVKKRLDEAFSESQQMQIDAKVPPLPTAASSEVPLSDQQLLKYFQSPRGREFLARVQPILTTLLGGGAHAAAGQQSGPVEADVIGQNNSSCKCFVPGCCEPKKFLVNTTGLTEREALGLHDNEETHGIDELLFAPNQLPAQTPADSVLGNPPPSMVPQSTIRRLDERIAALAQRTDNLQRQREKAKELELFKAEDEMNREMAQHDAQALDVPAYTAGQVLDNPPPAGQAEPVYPPPLPSSALPQQQQQ